MPIFLLCLTSQTNNLYKQNIISIVVKGPPELVLHTLSLNQALNSRGHHHDTPNWGHDMKILNTLSHLSYQKLMARKSDTIWHQR
jgi:hypothetical protein